MTEEKVVEPVISKEEELTKQIEVLKKLIPSPKSMSNIVEIVVIENNFRIALQIPNATPFDVAHKAVSKISAILTYQEEQAEKIQKMNERVESSVEEKKS